MTSTVAKLIVLIACAGVLGGCAWSEEYRLERATAMAEKREQAAYERMACEESSKTAWMCTSGNERARENYPWLHCSCVDNRSALR